MKFILVLEWKSFALKVFLSVTLSSIPCYSMKRLVAVALCTAVGGVPSSQPGSSRGSRQRAASRAAQAGTAAGLLHHHCCTVSAGTAGGQHLRSSGACGWEFTWQRWLCFNLTESWGRLLSGSCSEWLVGPRSWPASDWWECLLQQNHELLQKKQYELSVGKNPSFN